MHRRMLLTERLLNKARRTAHYKGYRRKRAFLLPRKEGVSNATSLYHKVYREWEEIRRGMVTAKCIRIFILL